MGEFKVVVAIMLIIFGTFFGWLGYYGAQLEQKRLEVSDGKSP